MRLTPHLTRAVIARREKLLKHVGDTPALIAAGSPPSRNFPAAHYPFRASSHFLYLVGMGVPNGVLALFGGQFTLFVPAPKASDALWHGATPSLDAIAEAVGCQVLPLDRIADQTGLMEAATLDPTCPMARAQLRALIQRPVGFKSAWLPRDERLMQALIDLRSVHDAAAIVGLREAVEITVVAHQAGMAATQVGRRESDIRAMMEAQCLARDVPMAYGPIVTTAGEVLHNDTYHRKLGDGDLLLADVGAESPDGWAADVTRTWPVNGRFSSTQAEIYDLVLAAENDAIEMIAPGVRYRDVHLRAAQTLTEGLVSLGILKGDPAELLADGAHALFFPHGAGHLLGLDVHDMEDLGDRAGYAPGRERSEQFGLSYLRLDRDLVAGMAVTIEPGFYQVPAILADEALMARLGDRLNRPALERFSDVRGIRIEDDILVTETGYEVLTDQIPRSRDEVEAVVGTAGAANATA